MKVLILEDIQEQGNMLAQIVEKKFGSSKIVVCENDSQLMNALERNTFDVLLIDIQISGDNSIDYMQQVIDKYPRINSKIIYITAHQKYAMDAINKTHCFGFLLKPYDEEEISEVITSLINANNKNHDKVDFFDFKIRGNVHFVNKDHILFFEIQNKKPIMHTLSEVFYMPRTTVFNLMDKLNNGSKNVFVRCRRDNIVNINQIAHIKSQGSVSYVVLHNGVKVPIGEKYKDDLFFRLKI